LHSNGARRETIRKTVSALAMTFDHHRVQPNPARDKLAVRLPRQQVEEIQPPTAAHVEDVCRVIAATYRLPMLVLEATGMRVGELEGLRWGDLDEPDIRWRVRGELNHTGRSRWVMPLADLFAAVVERVPREDRDLEAQVFPGLDQAAFRTELTRAWKRAGVPHFSPHDLRHRRITLWHYQGVPFARIGERVGQRSLRVTSETYTHVIMDERELLHTSLL
jgi:integrase